MSDEIPEGYAYEPSPSAFPNYVGRIFHKKATNAEGRLEHWTALRLEDHHVNSWGKAHGGLIAFLAEIGTSSAAWEPGGPPVVAIELNTHFIRAPEIGDLIEVRGVATTRTRSLVFVEVHAFTAGKLVFTATAINKVLAASA
jgi:acyl-coenzyme A thioesterase PaaI-like protein